MGEPEPKLNTRHVLPHACRSIRLALLRYKAKIFENFNAWQISAQERLQPARKKRLAGGELAPEAEPYSPVSMGCLNHQEKQVERRPPNLHVCVCICAECSSFTFVRKECWLENLFWPLSSVLYCTRFQPVQDYSLYKILTAKRLQFLQ